MEENEFDSPMENEEVPETEEGEDTVPHRQRFRIWAGIDLFALVLGMIGVMMSLSKFQSDTFSLSAESELASGFVGIGKIFLMLPGVWFLMMFIWGIVVIRKPFKSATAYWIQLVIITLLGAFPALLSFHDGIVL